MANYVVGDLQGCFAPLKQLLQEVAFNPARDHLYLVGDIVARGPDSLGCLDFVFRHQDCMTVTLGNHDLHLICNVLLGNTPNPKDKLDDLYKHSKLPEYLRFLSSQPLCVYLEKYRTFISHAGIHPDWQIEHALALGQWAQQKYMGSEASQFLPAMYGKESRLVLEKDEQSRFNTIVNVFTRMRFLTAQWHLDFDNKGTLDDAGDLRPWFTHPRFQSDPHRYVFGHWAALQGITHTPNVTALDTGCVWGGPMTLLDLDRNEQISSN
ncbi:MULTISPECIES: symmetrical bis(5'-nucleosyl)-tetraphosphatase [unclassified Pseudoalteromonas]|uniref:symmetrical bis(5'-nucleosyl)-tetraphosphatase n=1 Tax=unclassified Pseudoalteromonas TaxID=194690 RepID=UPI00209704BA|nr:symmetrical bis(5'-nucleosyl)-tetraphosphatase [Pseudoalteromonas sp. XMcav2-N]MCO7186884.1 symmetrical bis(5'-nucleosyl)-tetraphosphatase [Pseudoalteromonas sp. XMcav2-N]